MEWILKIVVTGLIFFYIAFITRKEAEFGNLFFSKWVLYLGFICLVLSLGMLYILLSGQVRDEFSQYFSIGLLIISFGGAGIASILEYKMVRGKYNNKRIIFSTPWSGCKSFLWSEIKKITYNDLHMYVLHHKNGKKIRLSEYITGLDDVLYIIEQHENIKIDIK